MLGIEQLVATGQAKAPSNQVDLPPSPKKASAGKQKRRGTKDQDISEIQIKLYVKNDLFTKRKFIIKQSELDYSSDPNSICFQCLQFCQMDGEEEFWERCASMVNTQLNAKRNHVQNKAKDEYLSEFSILPHFVFCVSE